MRLPETLRRLGGGPVLVAHRGLPRRAPENAALALALARDAGAPVVELDARPAAGDLLVALHDATPRRLTGEPLAAAALPAETLIGRPLLDDPKERLLLLDEALALLAGRTTIDIELKPEASVAPQEIARRLLDALGRAGDPAAVIVTSESEAILREVKRRAPLLATGLVHRSAAPGDAIDRALSCAASLLVANARRIDAALAGRAREHGLPLWGYTVDDPAEARRLLDAGCSGIVTNDYPSLAAALRLAPPEAAPAPLQARETLLAIDLGSTVTKAALVDPLGGIVASRRAPTPVSRPAPGRVEHDPFAVLFVVRTLVDDLAREARSLPPPRGAAIAVQRSTGLLADRSLEPLSAALSWRDRRGESFVVALGEPARARLARIAGFPLAAAWTAVKGRVLFDALGERPGTWLLPLGAFVAARLTGEAPWVDPTLANRTYLVDARTGRWSEELASAFELPLEALPPIRPTIGEHGTIDFGGRPVPLRVLIGDQQAAYVGAAGPLGERLVVNTGTASFVMRALERPPALPEARIAPLWTSVARRRPPKLLVELPVLSEEEEGAGAAPAAPEGGSGADLFARAIARAVALGDPAPRRLARRLGVRAARLAGPRDRTIVVAGGGAASPHLVRLLEEALPLPPSLARERELTLLGAARLAAAASGLRWGVPPAGGLSPAGPPPV